MTIELAIHAPDLNRLRTLVATPDSRRGELEWLKDLPEYGRLYFGSEFCQHLLPTEDEIREATAIADERGWEFTLLTSYSTDEFVQRACDRLARLLEWTVGRAPEVVVNDWGILRRVRAEFADKVDLRLGRGLNRMQRDPRLPDVGPEHLGGDSPPETWRQSSLHNSGFQLLLQELGVSGVELDLPLVGLDALPASDLPTSLHAPWGMVASGRICMVNAWGKPASRRFVPPMHCDAPCRRFSIELRAPWARRQAGAEQLPLVDDGQFIPLSRLLNRRKNQFIPAAEDPAPRFHQKGNTHFYRLEGSQVLDALRTAGTEPGIHRLVVAPDLPL